MEYRELFVGFYDNAVLKKSNEVLITTLSSLPSPTPTASIPSDFGSGFAYTPTSSVTKDRFIIWRATGSILTLHEVSLIHALKDPILRIHFPHSFQILPNVIIFEDNRNNNIYVIVATTARTLHRFIFPYPSTLKSGDHSSIFENVTPSSIDSPKVHITNITSFKNNPNNIPVTINAVDPNQIIFGCTNGSMISLRIPAVSNSRAPIMVEDEYEIKEGVSKLLSWFSSTSTANSSSVNDIAIHDNYIIALYADLKIKVWPNRKSASSVLTKDIPPEVNVNITSVKMKYSKGKNSSQFRLVVQKSLETESHFLVYDGSIESGVELTLKNTVFSSLLSTTDFDIKDDGSNILWTLFSNEKNPLSIQYTQLPPIDPDHSNNGSNGSRTALSDVNVNDSFNTTPYMPKKQDIGEFFLNKMLEPSMFSLETLFKALQSYQFGTISDTINVYLDLNTNPYTAIRDQINVVLNTSIDEKIRETDKLTGAQEDRIIYSEWKRLWEFCVIHANREQRPLGLFINANEHEEFVWVIKTGSLSVIRKCHIIEALNLYPLPLLENLASPTISSTLSSHAIQSKDNPKDIAQLLICCKNLNSRLGQTALSEIEEELWFTGDTTVVIPYITEVIEGNSGNKNDKGEFMRQFRDRFISIGRPLETIDFLKSLIEKFFVDSKYTKRRGEGLLGEDEEEEEDDDEVMNIDGLILKRDESYVIESALSATYRQLVRTSFEFIRDLTLVLFLLDRMGVQSELTPTDQRNLKETTIPKISSLLIWCYVFDWIGKQAVPNKEIENVENSFEDALANLAISSKANRSSAGFKDMNYTLDTLPLVYLRSYTRGNVRSVLQASTLNTLSSNSYRSVIIDSSKIASKLLYLMFPFGNVSCFGFFLARYGLYNTITIFFRLIGNQSHLSKEEIEFNGLGVVHYLNGLSYLHLGEFENSQQEFTLAASQIGKSPSILEFLVSNNVSPDQELLDSIQLIHVVHSIITSKIPTRLEPLDIAEISSKYYVKCMTLVERMNKAPHIVVQFAKKALEEIQTYASLSGTSVETLYYAEPLRFNVGYLQSHIFKFSLILGDYMAAYFALTNNPDPDRKRSCLSRLVTELCEKNQVGKLCSLQLHGLVDSVELILKERAKAVDVNSTPNWYQILYAFYVKRNNYRRAGTTMYHYAQRLANEFEYQPKSKLAPHPGTIFTQYINCLEQQLNAYLLAINALKLVEDFNQWIPAIEENDEIEKNEGENTHTEGLALSPKRRRVVNEEIMYFLGEKTSYVNIIGIDDIERQYMLTSSILQLAKTSPQKLQNFPTFISPNDLCVLLVNAGLYDSALSLALLHHTNNNNHTPQQTFSNVDLKYFFDSLTRMCIELQENEGDQYYNVGNGASLESEWLHTPSGDYTDSPSLAYWRALQELLELYNTEGIASCFTISQLISMTKKVSEVDLRNNAIRLSGTVEIGSIQQETTDNAKPRLIMKVTDHKNYIEVEYQGRIPKLLREGGTVVVEGNLSTNNIFQAKRILLSDQLCFTNGQNIVAERLVSSEPPHLIPPWLLSWYEAENNVGLKKFGGIGSVERKRYLLQIYMKYARWDEASSLAIDILNQAISIITQISEGGSKSKKPSDLGLGKICLPYVLFDHLLKTLSDELDWKEALVDDELIKKRKADAQEIKYLIQKYKDTANDVAGEILNR